MFGTLSRYSRAIACVRRYSNAPDLGEVAHLVAGLHGPADERREPAGLVLHAADAVEVFDALGVGFDVPEHHRGRPLPAQPVPHAGHFQPLVGQGFVLCELFANAIHEDFAPAAGEAA